jgi:hypothetical protein
LVKNSDLNARQCVQSFLQDASSFDALVGDDEGFVDTNALALLPEQRDCAKVELDLSDVVDEGHGVAVYDLKTEL